ncbi:MAG: hypothetical protein U1F49_07785 [Rubrivivax sp.]
MALIDRGSCAVSLKIDRAKKAGAIGAYRVVNNAGGDPPSFSFGGVTTARADDHHHAGRRQPHQDGAGCDGSIQVVGSVNGSATIPLVGSMHGLDLRRAA